MITRPHPAIGVHALDASQSVMATGAPSVSLGRDTYRELLSSASLALLGEHDDEGKNPYFRAQKAKGARV